MSFKRILITTGDPDGIGFEVTVKALVRIGAQKNIQFYVFCAPHISDPLLRSLKRRFKVETFLSWAEASSQKKLDSKKLMLISSRVSPALWVETAATACLTKTADVLVTAPLSKECIRQAGFSEIGHTGILTRVCQSKDAFMGFLGDHFNVVLATGHIPVSAVAKTLNPNLLENCFHQAVSLFASSRGSKKAKRPMAILGLNPHAGDLGIIGHEEVEWLNEFVQTKKTEGHLIEGPLPADSAFQKENWARYSGYMALYHDQGLIPFKTVHGHKSGIHVTLGLPLKRVSVDHGTAKNLFGKNKASANSMIESVRWAINEVQK